MSGQNVACICIQLPACISVLFCDMFAAVLYCTVQCSTALYSTVLLCSSILHYAVQYYTRHVLCTSSFSELFVTLGDIYHFHTPACRFCGWMETLHCVCLYMLPYFTIGITSITNVTQICYCLKYDMS